jgi:hypothetical protein
VNSPSQTGEVALASFWAFTRADDTRRLAAAKQGLPSAPGPEWSLERAFEPPWGAWALRVGDELGLAHTAAPVAAAIAALTLETARDETWSPLARWGWGTELLMQRAGGVQDIRAFQAWLCSVAVATHDRRALPATSWKLNLTFAAPAWLAGKDPAPWLALGVACARLVAILASFERLWLDPQARDIELGVPSEWVDAALEATPQALLLALAGNRIAVTRKNEVRAVLERPAVERVVRARFAAALAAARAALTRETAALGAEFVGALESMFARAQSFLFARTFAPPATSVASLVEPWSVARCRDDVARAIERVEREPTWSSSVDAQRWGVAPVAADVVADFFPRGLIELALDETVGGRTARIRALLEDVRAGDLRYYRDFRFVPPDIDSLGLALELGARLPEPPSERLASWLALLPENLGSDGVPHVWLLRSAAGPTHDPPEVEWAGNRCTACLLSLLLGLLALRPASALRVAHSPVIEAVLEHVLGCLDEDGFSGCHHYPPEYATYLFFRVVARLANHARASAARDRLAERLLARQKLDGSWGSPQRTAWCLEAIAGARLERNAVERALRYLAESQRGDGAWHAELVYYTVGKPGLMVEYRSVEVTTAMCARAMHRGLAALELE